MDMEPLEQNLVVSPAERRRKSQQLIPRGSRSSCYNEEDDPPILMMSSMSGEGDSIGLPGGHSSSSKRMLLIKDDRTDSENSSGLVNSRGKKHDKKVSRVGMSTKITRALFRERRTSNSNFSKIQDAMSRNSQSSNFFKRSAMSPFRPVEPRLIKSTLPRDLGAAGVTSSFDTVSISGQNILKPLIPPQPPPGVRQITTGSCFIKTEPAAMGNVSALSVSTMDSDYSSFVHTNSPHRQLPPTPLRTMASGTIPVSKSTRPPMSVASSLSSLHSLAYSDASNDQYNIHYPLIGEDLADTASVPTRLAPAQYPHDEPRSVSSRGLVQQNVLAGLNDAIHTTTTPKMPSHTTTFPTIKPPPYAPPKAPRRMVAGTKAKTGSYTTSPPIAAPAGRTPLSLKQHEERLLQGGHFLNESTESATDTKGNLALKLLHRLETAQSDGQLMADHHHQDPPLLMCGTSSFGSSTLATRCTHSFGESTIATRRTTSGASLAHASSTLTSNSMARASSNQSTIRTVADHYAGFIAADDYRPRVTPEQRSRLLVTSVSPVEESKEVEEDEDEVVKGEGEGEGEESTTKLCYLYSQDKEFENSILSPSPSPLYQRKYNHNVTITSLPLPTSPKEMYRSEAIDAFLEQTQANINSSCSKAHCPRATVIEAADPAMAEVVGSGATINDDRLGSQGDGDDVRDQKPTTTVSEEFLNIMASGCAGMPKESVKEKLVALEAGWSGFRNQVNDKINLLEESWQTFTLNGLLQCNSPKMTEQDAVTTSSQEDAMSIPEGKAYAVRTPSTVASTTMATPSTMSTFQMEEHQTRGTPAPVMTPKAMFGDDPLQELELISQTDKSIVGVMKSPLSMKAVEEEVVLGVVRQTERNRTRSFQSIDRYANPEDHAIERIQIGTCERDVPLSLKDTLADISDIVQGGKSNAGNNSGPHKQSPDSSRDDSEGGKVALDVADWDPVNSSECNEEEVEVSQNVQFVHEVPPLSSDHDHTSVKGGAFVFLKRKMLGKKKSQSPKSVLMEI